MDLRRRQATERAGLQPPEHKRTDCGANEARDVMTKRREHPSHLAVPPFSDRDLDEARDRASIEQPNGRRLGRALLELHAAGEQLERPRRNGSPDLGDVGLGHFEAGMREVQGEVAVVREEQRSFGVDVEAADRPHVYRRVDEIDHGRATLRIVGASDHTYRLVQQVVRELCAERDTRTIYLHYILILVDTLPEVSAPSVDPDPPLLDHLFDRPAGADAGPSQNLLQALPF